MSENILHLVSDGVTYAVNVGIGTGVIKYLTADQKDRLKEILISKKKINPPRGSANVNYIDEGELDSVLNNAGGSRRRPSRKYKKSKRVFRKKSRSTRRR